MTAPTRTPVIVSLAIYNQLSVITGLDHWTELLDWLNFLFLMFPQVQSSFMSWSSAVSEDI